MKKQTVADLYRSRKVEKVIVEVTPPSGLTFKFYKPSPLRFVLSNGLPLGLASQSVDGKDTGANQEELLKALFKIRDQVVELSFEPKITLKPASEALPGELAIEELEDEDLNYFITWVANGGNEGDPALARFRSGQGADAVAGSDSPKFGVASKRSRRN